MPTHTDREKIRKALQGRRITHVWFDRDGTLALKLDDRTELRAPSTRIVTGPHKGATAESANRAIAPYMLPFGEAPLEKPTIFSRFLRRSPS